MITVGKAVPATAPAPPLLPFEQAVEAVLSDLPHPLSVLGAASATAEPVVGVRFAPGAIAYVVVDPRLVTEVLTARRGVFERDREFIRAFTPVLGTGLITDQTPQWARRRRQVQGALRRSGSRLAAITAQSTAALVASWSGGEVRDLGATVGALHWEILARTVCGRAGDGLADPSSPARGEVVDSPGAGWRRIRSAVASAPFCARTTAGLLGPGPADEWSDQVTTLLFGGRDTTASAITWTLIALARHSAVQARLRDELRFAVAGGELAAGSSRRAPVPARGRCRVAAPVPADRLHHALAGHAGAARPVRDRGRGDADPQSLGHPARSAQRSRSARRSARNAGQVLR